MVKTIHLEHPLIYHTRQITQSCHYNQLQYMRFKPLVQNQGLTINCKIIIQLLYFVVLNVRNWFLDELQAFRSFSFFMQSYSNFLENNQASYHTNRDLMFIFSYQYLSSSQQSMFLYVEMLHDEKIINHHFLVNTMQGWQEQVDQINYQTYEGDWMLCYFYIDLNQNTININYYSTNLDRNFQSQIDGRLQQDTLMQCIIGSYMNLEFDNKLLYLQSFTGLLLNTIITQGYDLFEYFHYVQACDIGLPCQYFQLNLINYIVILIRYLQHTNDWQYVKAFTNQQLIGQKSIPQNLKRKFVLNQLARISIKIKQMFSTRQYLIQGWIKQDSLQFQSQLDSLLLRVTINQQYLDNLQIGDRDLYILYHQNEAQISKNGFSLETYSYTFPYKPQTYTSSPDDTLYVLNSKYKFALLEWHYFQYEIGTQTNNQQPVYRVYFPSIDLYEEHKWGKEINHFSNTQLFFHIGGDDYYPNSFKGKLSDWNFKYFCSVQETIFKPKCDYTCQTCKGITAYDCLTCAPFSNRIYSIDQNTCGCLYGYIAADGQQVCQTLYQYNGVLAVQEIEIKCDKEGYYQCDDVISCQQGYFMVGNVCVKCPHYDSSDQNTIIKCADCYLHPEIFSQQFSCITSLIANTEQEVFIETIGYNSDQEIYNIVLIDENNFELELIKGIYEGHLCKLGFFENNEGICTGCMDYCQSCITENICTQCIFGYYMGDNGLCKPCKMCRACEQADGQEYCYYEDNCVSQTYWMNNKCYECGSFCEKCNFNQCFYCINDQDYYLTLDGINCARCSVRLIFFIIQFHIVNIVFNLSMIKKTISKQLQTSIGKNKKQIIKCKLVAHYVKIITFFLILLYNVNKVYQMIVNLGLLLILKIQLPLNPIRQTTFEKQNYYFPEEIVKNGY